MTADDGDHAPRRTHLANERTYLAWWRAGLTALAAGVGTGRVVPSLAHQTRWPYAVLGGGFTLVGIAAIAYGLHRHRAVRDAMAAGRFAHADDRVLAAMTGVCVVLGALLFILVVVET